MISIPGKYLCALFVGLLFLATSASPGYGQNRNNRSKEAHAQARATYIDGIAAFENENYREALSLLKDAYVILSDQAGVNHALSDAFFELGDLTNAAHYGQQATELDPDNIWYQLNLAQIYTTGDNLLKAATTLEKAQKIHPNNHTLLKRLADTYEQTGQLEKANSLYRKLLFLEGENLRYRMRRVENFNQLNQADSALSEINRIRKRNPDNGEILETIASQYLQMGMPQEAKKVLDKVGSSLNGKTVIMRAEIYFENGGWESARKLLTRFSQDATASVEEKAEVGRFLLSSVEKNPQTKSLQDISTSVFQALIKSEPKSNRILSTAAEFFLKTGQFSNALNTVTKINSVNPSDDSAWKTRLELLLRQGDFKTAVSVGEEAARQIPQDPFILYFLGNAYLANQKYEQAVSRLEEAITLPARMRLKNGIYSTLGDSYAGLKKWDKAFENYESALQIDSDNALVLNNYAYYLAKQNENLKKAQSLSEKALNLEPENPSYLDTFGLIRLKQGHLEEAESYFRKSIDLGKDSAEIMEHLGNVLFKLGNKDEARTFWKKALDKDSSRTYLKEKISS